MNEWVNKIFFNLGDIIFSWFVNNFDKVKCGKGFLEDFKD